MIGALTLSILVCIYLYSKHRQSTDQIRVMIAEFEKLQTNPEPSAQIKLANSQDEKASFFSFSRRQSSLDSDKSQSNLILSSQLKENQLIAEKNVLLTKELTNAKVSF